MICSPSADGIYDYIEVADPQWIVVRRWTFYSQICNQIIHDSTDQAINQAIKSK
jgi:hypothetical protein